MKCLKPMPKKKSVDTELLSAITTIVQTETRKIVKEEIQEVKDIQNKHTGMILDLRDTAESIDHRLTNVEAQQGQMIDTMEGIAKKVDRHDAEIAASLSNYDRIVKQLRLT